MERATKKFTTSGGYEIEIKTYLTFGENREITNVYLEGAEMGMDETGKPKMSTINVGLTSKAQDKAIELLVVSVNGEKENIVKLVQDLPIQDGNELVEELNKIQNPITTEKKTN